MAITDRTLESSTRPFLTARIHVSRELWQKQTGAATFVVGATNVCLPTGKQVMVNTETPN